MAACPLVFGENIMVVGACGGGASSLHCRQEVEKEKQTKDLM